MANGVFNIVKGRVNAYTESVAGGAQENADLMMVRFISDLALYSFVVLIQRLWKSLGMITSYYNTADKGKYCH
ncbi:hypothetical protein [Microbulbifer sp. 2205BS26-8]|uniref:hypothetical protein n=1 Tax=Microbulbifer sp. 2205BS26-8 TaxID=3064386 RepID=UPI00273F8F3C|nr:hypothetical protein [Microbulbifer sp. 2205BS26-8]MDP5211269.1 hypothetical protein [Microbulbifer sp. 2205BS26-8]